MAILVTPGQLNQRAELYHQLSALTTAGIGLPQALNSLLANPPSWTFRKPLTGILDQINRGSTFTEALKRQGKWMPVFDIALLDAGERSGRLDACFKLLSIYYGERAQMMREVISAMSYPLFVLHFGIFIFPFATFITSGNLSWYLRQTLGNLLPAYAVVLMLFYACQGRHGDKWRSILEKATRWIPLLGAGRRHLALARLSTSLEALISAGVSIIEAWDLAAAASGSPALARVVAQWKPRLQGGQTPAELVRESRMFPDVFVSLYATGEQTGKLDETLRRLYTYYQESGSRKLKALAQWLPKLIYIGILIALGFYIIRFWVNYYDNVFKAIS